MDAKERDEQAKRLSRSVAECISQYAIAAFRQAEKCKESANLARSVKHMPETAHQYDEMACAFEVTALLLEQLAGEVAGLEKP